MASDGATIYLIANGNHNEGTETGGDYPSSGVMQEATITFFVTDGTATIGAVGGDDGTAGEHKAYVEEGYWWYKADNFRLVKNRNLDGPVYAVVGSNKDDENDKVFFSSTWDAATQTDILTEESEGVYTKTYTDLNLNAQTIAYKFIKKADTEATTADEWYTNGEENANSEISIPVKGKYDITFTFTEEGSVVSGEATKTAEAVTIGNKGWATTVTNSALNFAASTVEAYTAKVEENKVILTAVKDVKAETGLVLKGDEGTYYIPVIESSETDKGSLMFSSIYGFDIYSYYTDNYYGLTVDEMNIAKFALINKPTGDNKITIPAQKAFLAVSTTSAHELSIVFEENETTGIDASLMKSDAVKGQVYNLNGQRVNAPAKGLFIINGKKVVVK